jgi:hypothetical protein
VERSISDDGESNEIQKKGMIGIGPNYLPRSGLVQCNLTFIATSMFKTIHVFTAMNSIGSKRFSALIYHNWYKLIDTSVIERQNRNHIVYPRVRSHLADT